MSTSPSSATAYGAYPVGMSARVVAVSASAAPPGFGLHIANLDKFRAARPNPKHPDALERWARELRSRVAVALKSLSIEPDFAIEFDVRPPVDARLDLAALAACLGAAGKIGDDALGSTLFLGELSSEGAVRQVRGVLSTLRAANRETKPPRPWTPGDGSWRAVVSRRNVNEALRGGSQFTFAIEHARELIGNTGWPFNTPAVFGPPYEPPPPMGLVIGSTDGLSPRVMRALAVAATGRHGVALVGPSDLRVRAARVLRALLPPMTEAEAIETTAIAALSGGEGHEATGGLVRHRPLRAPHHTCSVDGLIGGGDPPRPGEASLATNGVLCLDVAPEFKSNALDSLGSVLLQGEAVFVRRGERASFPASHLLVLGIPPCKCEEHAKLAPLAQDSHERWCGARQVAAYHARAFGPGGRLDRKIDLWIELDPNEARTNFAEFKELRDSVARAQGLDTRFGEDANGSCERVLRVAQSIAVLEGSRLVLPRHRDEAEGIVFGELFGSAAVV